MRPVSVRALVAGLAAAATLATVGGGDPVPFHEREDGDWLVRVNETRVRSLAARALVRKFPGLSPADFKPSYLIYVHDPRDPARSGIVVEWIGRKPLALDEGESAAEDRIKVGKLRVRMTRDGRIQTVERTSTWLHRSTAPVDGE